MVFILHVIIFFFVFLSGTLRGKWCAIASRLCGRYKEPVKVLRVGGCRFSLAYGHLLTSIVVPYLTTAVPFAALETSLFLFTVQF